MSVPVVSPLLLSSGVSATDTDRSIDGAGTVSIVFLHSLAGNSSQWSSQLEHLHSKRRAIALDWPDRRPVAPPNDGDYAIPKLADDVSTAVDRLQLARFILVGHSAGASVALAYAAKHPEHVAGLLLVDPAGDFRQVAAEIADPFLAGLASDRYAVVIEEYWRSILPGSSAEVQARILADLRAMPKEAVIGVFHALRQFDPVAALRSGPRPVLAVITPANDAPFSLHRLWPELPRETMTGTSHWLHMDRPQDFNRILDDFLARVEGISV